MQFKVIQRILGLLVMVFSLTMIPPMIVGWGMGDPDLTPFYWAFLIVLGSGFAVWLPVHKANANLRTRDGFLVVTLFWTVLSAAAALPLKLSHALSISFTDAMFEAVSGFTTTGSTVLTNLEGLPRSILFFRQEIQWLGGMGMIVLAVAILPMLGVGGMQLYKAEAPGPVKDSKLTPRIAETARLLWYIYLILTLACAFMYWFTGMTWFDAIGHSFATLSTAGFSTHDANFAYFDESRGIGWTAIFFMFMGGVNASLHFAAWKNLSLKAYWQDSEFRTYLLVVLGSAWIATLYLYLKQTYPSLQESLFHALFQFTSSITTTGFGSTNYAAWPTFLPAFLFIVSIVGGSAGSTAGGIKAIRLLLLWKQGMRELARLVHPNGRFVIKVNGEAMPENIVESVWGFFAAYVGVFVFFMLAVMATDVDQMTAFAAVASSLNNQGLGLGMVASNYAPLTDTATWLLTLAMLMGRLELFTMLVLLTPAFWRR
jgi:trk system potassium uptake protein TrkH